MLSNSVFLPIECMIFIWKCSLWLAIIWGVLIILFSCYAIFLFLSLYNGKSKYFLVHIYNCGETSGRIFVCVYMCVFVFDVLVCLSLNRIQSFQDIKNRENFTKTKRYQTAKSCKVWNRYDNSTMPTIRSIIQITLHEI